MDPCFAPKEEMLALEAIYGEEFERDADGCGFQLHILPFPGGGSQSRVSCNIHIRYGMSSRHVEGHSVFLMYFSENGSCRLAGMMPGTHTPLSS